MEARFLLASVTITNDSFSGSLLLGFYDRIALNNTYISYADIVKYRKRFFPIILFHCHFIISACPDNSAETSLIRMHWMILPECFVH